MKGKGTMATLHICKRGSESPHQESRRHVVSNVLLIKGCVGIINKIVVTKCKHIRNKGIGAGKRLLPRGDPLDALALV
jgi:hypothetical protein